MTNFSYYPEFLENSQEISLLDLAGVYKVILQHPQCMCACSTMTCKIQNTKHKIHRRDEYQAGQSSAPGFTKLYSSILSSGMHVCIFGCAGSAGSEHQQDQCISRIGASAGLVHQQERRISRIGASAGSAHQQHQRISSISASAASVHQQHQRISSISASAASAHQQHQRISSISSISAFAATAD